jgi:hypothetical protein
VVYDTLRLVRSSDTCSMLDSVRSAEKRGARFGQPAGSNSRASVQNAERPKWAADAETEQHLGFITPQLGTRDDPPAG